MKKLIVVAVLSLILQISGLYILNNFVFVDSLEFKTNKIDIETNVTKDIKGTIPSGADNVNLSYEGKYLTYTRDKIVYIEDTKTGIASEIKPENNGVIMCCKWIDNRDMLAIVEKVKKKGVEKIQLITYNAANSSEAFVKEICKYEKNLQVDNITTSALTNVYYIDINKGGVKSILYRIDRNEDLKKVDVNAEVLANMQVIPHEDRLIYEDKATSKIFATTPNKELTFKAGNKLMLLGIDRNDVIYVGEFNEDKILSITYGKVNESTSSWKKVNINSLIGKNDVYFNNKSEILINDNAKRCIKNLTTNNETEYEGNFIQIKEDFIASIDSGNNLIYTSLKKA